MTELQEGSSASTTVPLGPSLSWPGAVAAAPPWQAVAAHFGEPMREQRLLEEGLAAVDLSARGVVRISGEDRLRWLHSMTTQHLESLAPFESRESIVLSPHGHIEYDLHVVDDGEVTWITTDPGRAEPLVEWLTRMKFMLRVEVDDVSSQYAVIGEPIRAASTKQELQERGVIAWVDPWPAVVGDSASYSEQAHDKPEHPSGSWAWRELIVPRSRFDEEFGDRPAAGVWAFDVLRLMAWRPDATFDVDHRTLVHELDWLRTAVHLHKGCYRGQETVARVHNLGRPPRRLAFVHLDGSGHVLPTAGAEVFVAGDAGRHAGRSIGRLTSVGRHYLEGPVGLVVLKRSVPADATLLIDGVSAAQTPILAP